MFHFTTKALKHNTLIISSAQMERIIFSIYVKAATGPKAFLLSMYTLSCFILGSVARNETREGIFSSKEHNLIQEVEYVLDRHEIIAKLKVKILN